MDWVSDPVRLSKCLVTDYNSQHFEKLKPPPTISPMYCKSPVHQLCASSWRIDAAGWSARDSEVSHTHANYVHLCWKATALARRPSDSIRFFHTHNSHCIPLLVLWGLPLQIPLCVYTAAVLYGLFLICSIKHIVYKSVCLLGFFQGSNYRVKYHRKNYFVYSCILMYGEPETNTEPSYRQAGVELNSLCHGSVGLTVVVNDTPLKR